MTRRVMNIEDRLRYHRTRTGVIAGLPVSRSDLEWFESIVDAQLKTQRRFQSTMGALTVVSVLGALGVGFWQLQTWLMSS